MILYRPGFEDTPSQIETLIEKADKLYSLYEKSSIITLYPETKEPDEYYISENSIFIDEETKTEGKRKTTLLRRTTSEPRLTYKEIQSKENVDKTHDELDNPYNELYFYIFQNLLNEYIDKFKK
jgi:hypothetical protein